MMIMTSMVHFQSCRIQYMVNGWHVPSHVRQRIFLMTFPGLQGSLFKARESNLCFNIPREQASLRVGMPVITVRGLAREVNCMELLMYKGQGIVQLVLYRRGDNCPAVVLMYYIVPCKLTNGRAPVTRTPRTNMLSVLGAS